MQTIDDINVHIANHNNHRRCDGLSCVSIKLQSEVDVDKRFLRSLSLRKKDMPVIKILDLIDHEVFSFMITDQSVV